MKARALLLLLVAASLSGGQVLSQSFHLGSTAFGSAGGIMPGSPMRLGMTVGQSVAGVGASPSIPLYAEGAGFWCWGHLPVLDAPDPGASSPVKFTLYPNVPNPFDRQTIIRYAIPAAAGSVPVSVRIYDLSGRLVRALDAGSRIAGVHTVAWDGSDGSGHPLGGGVYYCRVTAGPFAATRRLVLTP